MFVTDSRSERAQIYQIKCDTAADVLDLHNLVLTSQNHFNDLRQ